MYQYGKSSDGTTPNHCHGRRNIPKKEIVCMKVENPKSSLRFDGEKKSAVQPAMGEEAAHKPVETRKKVEKVERRLPNAER